MLFILQPWRFNFICHFYPLLIVVQNDIRGFNDAVNGFADDGWSLMGSDGVEDVTIMINSSPGKFLGLNTTPQCSLLLGEVYYVPRHQCCFRYFPICQMPYGSNFVFFFALALAYIT